MPSQPGEPPRVLRPQRRGRGSGPRPARPARSPCTRPSAVSRSTPRQRRADRELEQRLPRRRPASRTASSPLGLPQLARVHPAGLDRDVGLRDEPLVLLEGAQRGLLPGLVAVEGEDDLAAERASSSPSSRRTTLMWSVPKAVPQVATAVGTPDRWQRHHVGVALDDHDLAAPWRSPASRGRCRRAPATSCRSCVSGVLRYFGLDPVVVEQPPGTETDDVAGHVADRPHQPAAEAVVGPRCPAPARPGGDQLVLGEALAAQVAAAAASPTAARSRRRTVAAASRSKPALGEELPRRRPAPRRARELLGEERLRDRGAPRPAAAGARARAAGRGRPPSSSYRSSMPEPRREPLDGLGERQVVDLLHERDDVAALAAAEAVVEADLRPHVERRRALVVERAEPLQRADPGRLEGDVLADDLLDARRARGPSRRPRGGSASHRLSPRPGRADAATSTGHAEPGRASRDGAGVGQRGDLVDDRAQPGAVVGAASRSAANSGSSADGPRSAQSRVHEPVEQLRWRRTRPAGRRRSSRTPPPRP